MALLLTYKGIQMKALITAILLTFTCNALAEEEKAKTTDDVCASIAHYAEQVAKARDRGVTAVKVLKITTNQDMKMIVVDAYGHRSYSPEMMSNRWIVKCYKQVNK